jgi:hypothetical protein
MCDDEFMKAAEFEGTVSADGQIKLPQDVASEIGPGRQLRIVLMWDKDEDEDWTAWRAAGNQPRESAYCPEDAIYEQLIDAPAPPTVR